MLDAPPSVSIRSCVGADDDTPRDRSPAFVANGEALLDDMRPGWWLLADLDTLDVLHPSNCILGQLYGRYDHGKAALGFTDGSVYGFALGDEPHCRDTLVAAYEELTELWRAAIRARRHAALGAPERIATPPRRYNGRVSPEVAALIGKLAA